MFKIEDVKVVCSDPGYKLVVAVYRSSITPKTITVHIEKIVPVPPRQPQEPLGEPDIAKVISMGDDKLFKAPIYPPGK